MSKKGYWVATIEVSDPEKYKPYIAMVQGILAKFGVDEAVIKAMQAHHEEYPYETPESMIVQVADAVSGARPGARHSRWL